MWVIFANMDRYIDQLEQMILERMSQVRPPSSMWDSVDFECENEVEDIAYNEKYIFGHGEKLEDILKIKYEELPPLERLTENQADKLGRLLEKLLNKWNFYPVFPEKVPYSVRYDLIKMEFLNFHVFVGGGRNEIEFCDRDDVNCPFTGYCTECEEWKEELKAMQGVAEELEGDIFSDLPNSIKDKKKIVETKHEGFIYQEFCFSNDIMEKYYPGKDFTGNDPGMDLDEIIEMQVNLIESEEGFMPELVKIISNLLGEENIMFDFWGFSPEGFSLFWCIKQEVYKEKMNLVAKWIDFEEIGHLVHYSLHE